MLIVGLTGGISSGKSTVSSTLKDKYNLTVVDADAIAKEVVLPGKTAYKQILTTFAGDIPGLVDPSTQMLNRAELGKAVFTDKAKLRMLNSIVHPAVKKEMAWQVLRAYLTFQKLVILDVPLLFESGISMICGKVVTITCDEDLQLQRLLARNPELSEEDARNRISNQSSNRERNARADIVVNNNGTKTELESQIQTVVTEITPNLIWTVLDYLPGFVFLSAGITFIVRQTIDNYKMKSLKKNK